MLSTGSSTSIDSLRLGNFNCDHMPEDNANKLTAYLHRVAGFVDMEVHSVVKDHCYARPWNWKPENIYVKPTKNIFFSSSSRQVCVNQSRDQLLSSKTEHIDVEHDDSSVGLILPYNLSRSRQCMNESQKLVNFIRPEEDKDDDWEETVEKTFWSPIQRRLFTRAYNIFRTERLSRLTKVDCATEPFHRRSSIDTTSKRFREILASTGWDYRIIQWLHTSLISNLSKEYLVIYLDILQTLRAKIPQLIDKMITTVQPNNTAVVQTGSIPLESFNSLLKRSWDPVSACLNANRPRKLPGNPILIVITSGVSTNLSSRQHKWITQLGTLGTVVTVHSHLGLSTNRMTMMTCMDQLVQATRSKIQDVRNDYPGRPMVLIGLNTGAALACQVAQMEHVTTVVCLGFPFITAEGKRGYPDDTLMDIRCPVMFVIGQNANLVRPDDLEDIRGKMLVETSLVVVGTADDHLRISTAKIIFEGITQAMVDRCILDEIGDFIGGILLQPHPLPLRPIVSLINIDKTTTKREPRKRKNSTSSSVDSESNSSNINKKLRPCAHHYTPAINSTSVSMSKSSISGLTTISESGTLVTLIGDSASNITHSIQRRNSKVSNNPKSNNSEQLHLARQKIQKSTNTSKANGGITLNIGSLASLAPIGPIRLTPSLSCSASTNLTSIQSSNVSKSLPPPPPPLLSVSASSPSSLSSSSSSSSSSVSSSSSSSSSSLSPSSSPSSLTVMKTSKMIPTNSNSYTITTSNKNSLKTIGTNNYKNINIQEQTGDTKLLTVVTSSGNQVRVASTSNSPMIQSKLIGGTTAPLTALLHSRKTPLMNNNDKASACNSSAILLTSPGELSSVVNYCSTMTSGTSSLITTTAITRTTTTLTKAMESSSHGASSINLTGMEYFAGKIMKNTSNNTIQSTIFDVNAKTKLSWLNNKNDNEKNADNTSIITLDSNKQHKNNWQKSLIPPLQTIGKLPIDVDNDLGNILDIPIILAEDNNNINEIIKASSSSSSSSSLSFTNNSIISKRNIGIKTGSFSLSSLSPSTTVLLLRNKDDQANIQHSIRKTNDIKNNEQLSQHIINNSNVSNHHVILKQTSMQNSSMSTIKNKDGDSYHTNSHCSTVNSPTIKCTKIILSKRNHTNANSSTNQVVLTKNSSKQSSSSSIGLTKNHN